MSVTDGKNGPVSGVGNTPFMGPSCPTITVNPFTRGCMKMYLRKVKSNISFFSFRCQMGYKNIFDAISKKVPREIATVS